MKKVDPHHKIVTRKPRRQRKAPVLTGTKPGPLQRQVLLVLQGARLLNQAQVGGAAAKVLQARYGRGLDAKEIAAVLSDAVWSDGLQRKVYPASVSGAISGMMVCGGRYWIAKHPRDRYTITRNGLAWL